MHPKPDDHFSPIARAYARGRLSYPQELFSHLARLGPGRRLAWDCATGSGQAALGLAEFFDQVEATDLSEDLLRLAPPHPRVRYRPAPAHASGLPDGSVDLVTVAQALHWFDLPSFESELRRVLRPGGIFAFWGYVWPAVTPSVDTVLEDFKAAIAPFWPARSALLHARYAALRFALKELPAPAIRMTVDWTLAEYLDHLASWSAVRYHREQTGTDILQEFQPRFASVWPNGAQETRWDLIVRIFQAT